MFFSYVELKLYIIEYKGFVSCSETEVLLSCGLLLRGIHQNWGNSLGISSYCEFQSVLLSSNHTETHATSYLPFPLHDTMFVY